MPVTLSPIIYLVTCEPKILDILEKEVYALFTIASELIVTEVKEKQPEKAEFPILVTLLGIVTEVKEEQPEKAEDPMLVTLLGIVIEVKEEQP